MKLDPAALQQAAQGVSSQLIAEHIARLPEAYFERFDSAAIADHLRVLADLSPLLPADVLVRKDQGNLTEVTVLGMDAPGLFSLIAGILMSLGFSISSGEVFTYTPSTQGRQRRRVADTLRRRRIVDVFDGRAPADGPLDQWAAELRQRLASTVSLLERHPADGLDQARQRVNEWVTERLEQLGPTKPRSPFATSMAFDRLTPSGAHLSVESQDTPAFLYSLSAALALHDVLISRVHIQTDGGRVHDELDVDWRGRGEGQVTEEQLRTIVLLTKQFTYFLDSAPDPYAALRRFDWLATHIAAQAEHTDWLAILADERSMPLLARLLGASDFLWEDFIRQRYDEVLTALQLRLVAGSTAPRPSLEELLRAKSRDQQRAQILAYRDREASLIQLEGVLDELGDPDALSRRLTGLAEEIVRASTALIQTDLTQRLGSPDAPFALFGLGKFGAGALGYASDLELLLVHGSDRPSAFYANLLEELQGSFRGKQDGLFELDLRLRPWGKNAALDCPIGIFEEYYGPDGAAHSLERIALTRLRAIGGDAEFGAQVETIRDRLIYERQWLNLEELEETRSRQFRQKEAGARNAKYSSGALVDIEYGVQILQVQHGRTHASLRTPQLDAVIGELGRLAIVTPEESVRLGQAYVFLRRLINALRMLHGQAEDLSLPAAESGASRYLARRMGYHDVDWKRAEEGLERDFALTTESVRTFVRSYVGGGMLPGRRDATVAQG